MNHLPHLPHLDQVLRRVRRNDQHVRMRLDEDARFFLVGFAQVVARRHGLGHAFFKVGGIANAGAVAANTAKIRQAVALRRIKAVHRLGQHQRQRVFARAFGARQDQRMRKPVRPHRLAQVPHRRRIPQKLLEAHGLSVKERTIRASSYILPW